MIAQVGLQAVFERFLPAYQTQHRLTPIQQKACWHIQQCRTAALGGLQQHCDQCGFEQPQYHSCRDRHCPQCQGRAQHAWCQQQMQAILPVTYYHLVFTLPHTLNGWVELHPEAIYRGLFQSVWETLNAFGQDPKRLNGTLGMTAVLHTWGQNLSRHVHLHCLVAGGALTKTGAWHPAKSNYLFPVRALSRDFRGRMVRYLRQSAEQGELHRITQPEEIDLRLDELMKTDWVVYTKAYLNRSETVVGYLARYSRKTALSNRRIQQIDDNQVHLRYKDYRDHGRHKVMMLNGEELIRRFLLHILPTGFMRIRHYGFLANRGRRQKLAQIRQSLQSQTEQAMVNPVSAKHQTSVVAHIEQEPLCPRCKAGHLIFIGEIAPKRREYG